jgi:Stage II sporulation protein E (SpoIIE)
MVADANAHPGRSSLRRLARFVLIGGALLALSTAGASAKPGQGKPGGPHAGSPPAGSHDPAAGPQTAPPAAGPAQAPAPAPSGAPSAHGRSPGGASPGHGAHGARRGKGKAETSGPSASSSPSASPGLSASPGPSASSGTTSPQPSHGSHGSRTAAGPRGGRGQNASAAASTESPGKRSGKGTGADSTALGRPVADASSATLPAAAATPAPAAAAGTPAPVASPSASTTPASRAATSEHRARTGHGQARRRPRRNALGRLGGVKAAFAAAPAASSKAQPVRGVATRRRSSAGHRRKGVDSPLVRTVTRIVGIVPVPMRVLIGLLLAMTLLLGLRTRLDARRARRLEAQRAALLEDVGLLQAALLPLVPERLGPVATSVAYRPAEGPGAGGDFYDVFALDDGQLAVLIGDVSGHGRQALPHTALIRFTLRAYLEAGLSPREALKTAATVLERQLGESFATVALATYRPHERVLTYACAGHPPPLVLGSRALEPVTVCSAPPLGAGMRTGTRQTIIALDGATRVCLYTDGVTEARVRGDLFGGERLADALASLGAGTSAQALLDEVARRTDARPDDMAACLLATEGGTAAPKVLREEIELEVADAASERTKRFLLACGVSRREVAGLLPLARAEAERAGTVLLGVELGGLEPQVTLRPDNVAPLHLGRTMRKAVVR